MQVTHDNLDLVVHAIEALSILGVGVAGILRLNYLIKLFHTFPPHRHVPGGFIVYPEGYEPPELGKLNGEAKP